MATGDDDNDVDGDGATSNEVDDDGDGATGDYNDDDDYDGNNDDDGDGNSVIGSGATGYYESKSALTTTMISGSTGAGEAYPPHLQFQTKAKTTDTIRLDCGVV